MKESLRGKQIILAGGSGGIGAACVELLAQEDASLVVSYRQNAARAERFREMATLVQADLVAGADRSKLLDAAPDLYGLVVLAGSPARPGTDTTPEQLMQISHDVNYAGPILLACEAVARMKQAKTAGSIVLFATMQAVGLFTGSAIYAAQKAALLHAARILAKECRGPANIRVNVICPGVTAAGMAEASIASGKYDHFLREGILHRFGRPGDIARAVRFFLEPDCYITGQVLSVDGGVTL